MATEEIEPRLSRLNKYYGVESEGIAFGMLDRNGTIVKCLLTYEAITERMGGAPTLEQQTEWFVANRSHVETIASEKFAAGAFSAGEFPIRIEMQNLNQGQFDF